MKTIIVTTDFSVTANNAVNYAADMTMSINAGLLLLNVVQTPISYSDFPLAIGLEDLMRNAEKDIKNLKEEVKRKVEDKINIETEVGMGVFFEELKDVCGRFNPYAVVLGSQGNTATEHLMFGEHAVHTAKNLHWPVITVPPEAAFNGVKKIGLASDLVQVVESRTVAQITTLINDFNAELHILNTGKAAVFNADIVFASAQVQETTMALKPTFHFIDNENADEGIMDFAHKNQIDLLIVLPKHHSFIANLFHKSHTKQLVLNSHVPVMALHQ